MTFIHWQLPVLCQTDFKAVQGPGRRPLKIQAVFIKTAAVAGALELVFSREPPRRAAEMGTLSKDGINAFFLADNPNTIFLLILFADFSYRVV